MSTRWDRTFFDSTRERVVTLLHSAARRQLSKAAAYTLAKIQPFKKWTPKPISFARWRFGVNMLPSIKGKFILLRPSPWLPANRLHWSFEDPSRVEGSEEERLAVFRSVTDRIRERIEDDLVGGNEIMQTSYNGVKRKSNFREP